MSYLLKPPLLRRLRLHLLQPIRLQHVVPHKEYFQNPGQMPNPEPVLQLGQSIPTPFVPPRRPLLRQIWNSVGLAAWSVLFGFGAGTGLITWAYLQDPFEPGSEDDVNMLEEITELMNEYPIMEGLIDDPEWEELTVAPRMVSGELGKGLNFVTGTLVGSRGIVQRIFYHRASAHLTMIVYFGNGVEGWPDVVHGGVLSTMLKDAIDKVASDVFPPDTGEMDKMIIQFKTKIIPGEVYCLSAMPANSVVFSDGESIESKFKMPPTERKDAIIAYIERADAPANEPTFGETIHALGYGVFKVRHPFQLDDDGNIT